MLSEDRECILRDQDEKMQTIIEQSEGLLQEEESRR